MGTDPIGKLLIRQAVPASIGILVMSPNILIDTFFVGQWIGANAIAAINVVLPVSFFIAALGMSIGMGGGSIISRALGSANKTLANKVFGNQITLTLVFTLEFYGLGVVLFRTNYSFVWWERRIVSTGKNLLHYRGDWGACVGVLYDGQQHYTR